MKHVATINAFPNKFGTFSGAIRSEKTRIITRERFDTFDEARNWVKIKSWELFGPIKYAPIARKGEYFANCWKIKEA